jgi:uncharacterized protein (DUF433 family)
VVEVTKDEVMVNVIREHIEIVQEALGPKARIAGHRIGVEDIAVWHEKLGMSPDEIVYNYPTITLADVYAALAYYWDHRDEIEQAIAGEKAFVEEFRKHYTSPLERKLGRSRRA